MFEELATGLAANVLYGLGRKAIETSGPSFKALAHWVRGHPNQLLFIPEAAGITISDAVSRTLVVRLVLLGSATWAKDRPISMEPCFHATIMPPGSGSYYFAKDHAFTTKAVPRGMHVYFIGEQPLRNEHASLDSQLEHGVLFDGQVIVERLGSVPIFPIALLAGRFGEGGGYSNQPIEQHVPKT